jgi:hypothetical protein
MEALVPTELSHMLRKSRRAADTGIVSYVEEEEEEEDDGGGEEEEEGTIWPGFTTHG